MRMKNKIPSESNVLFCHFSLAYQIYPVLFFLALFCARLAKSVCIDKTNIAERKYMTWLSGETVVLVGQRPRDFPLCQIYGFFPRNFCHAE